eukprot:5461636-Amphidinium_carterae.1
MTVKLLQKCNRHGSTSDADSDDDTHLFSYLSASLWNQEHGWLQLTLQIYCPALSIQPKADVLREFKRLCTSPALGHSCAFPEPPTTPDNW